MFHRVVPISRFPPLSAKQQNIRYPPQRGCNTFPQKKGIAMQIASVILWSIFVSAPGFSNPSIENYGMLPIVGRVVISPNGEIIAFRRTKSDKNDLVVTYSLKEKKRISALRVNNIDPQTLFFADNDHLILIASKRVDWRDFKDHFDAGSIYTFNIHSQKVEPLIKLGENVRGQRYVFSGQSIGYRNIAGKSPSGKDIYIGAYVSESENRQRHNYSLLRVNITGKGKPKIVQHGSPDVVNYFLDDTGQVLAREEYSQHTNKHSILSYSGKQQKRIYGYTAEIRSHYFVGLTSDYKALIYLNGDDKELVYHALNLETGKSTFAHSVSGDVADVLTDHKNMVVGTKLAGLIPTYELFDQRLDDRVNRILNTFPQHSVAFSSWTEDWSRVVVQVSGSSYAGDYYLIDKDKPPTFLTTARPGIKTEDINPLAIVTIKAGDGLEIPTILTLPRAHLSSLKSLPAVILPHGGPEAHDQIRFDYMAQALASEGYVVVQPQFRGSSGFGQKHVEAGWGEWGKLMQKDLTDTIRFLTKKQMIDPKRVCIAGASYGGYAALAGAAFTPDIYRCAFSLAGVSHIPKMLAADKRRLGKNHENLAYFAKIIASSDGGLEELNAISPYYSADKVKIPVMLVHGEDDDIVEFEQSSMMYKALKKAGKEVSLVKLKHEDHYLREGSTRLQALEALIKFMRKHLSN